MTPLEACDAAVELLRKVGFVHVRTSMKTTLCYYALPGRIGTIRVSTHSRKKDRRDLHRHGRVVSHITFPWGGKKNLLPMSVEFATCWAIGHYMLKARYEA